MRKNVFGAVLTVTCAALGSAGAAAQSTDGKYPSKPIRVLVPFPPGGTPDIQIRMLGEHLAQRMGQPFVVDNRGGASGTIALETAARAQPDGYTLIIGTVGNWTVTPHLFKLSFDVQRDFTHIIHIATTPGVLIVHPALPVNSVKDMIANAQKNPGALNYGSSGIGGFGHMCTELFSAMTKTRYTHVAYKGVAAAMTELMGGHIQFMFNSAAPSMPHIKAARMRGLATTGATRLAMLADLPTVAEAGVPGYENTSWSAIAGPAHLPAPVTARLNREMNAVLQLPGIRERFTALGSTITGTTPLQAAEILNAELAKYGKLITNAGIPRATSVQ